MTLLFNRYTYLTIGWSAPEDIGASAITSYDLRYIRSDATDKGDDHWTPKTGIWSAGDLVYELAGLTLDVGYDVQVRAVNSAGAGPWSEVAQAQTMTIAPGAPTIDGVVAGDGEFTFSWSAPARNGGAEITRYDVRYIEEDETDRADSNWDVETAWNTGGGALEYTVSSINNGLGYDIEVQAANSIGGGAWSTTAMLRRNQRPRFSPTEDGMRSVDENTPSGRAVGAPVAATDEEGDTLTYSIAESGAAFAIDTGTGQLRTKDALDHEAAESRTVTVQVSDGKNARGDISTAVDATIVVTVTVNDVNEQPTADPDRMSTFEDEPVMIDVLSNDSDPDDGDTMTVRIVTPPSGTTMIEGDRTVMYTPGRDFYGDDNFTYEVRDTDGLTARASVEVEIMAVNDAPVFASATTARTVSENAVGGDRVGAPVTATDIDSNTLSYGLFGTDASSFEIDGTGRITVGMGTMFDITGRDTYEVTVEADDNSGEANATTTIDVTITVTARPVAPPPIVGGGGGGGFGGGGGGGGGGGPSGPVPSDLDFEWTVSRDVEEFDSAHDTPSGLWSDGSTLFIAQNGDGADDGVYAYDLESGERVEAREFGLADTNRAPRGLWSDGETAWVSDSGRDRLFAYNATSGTRLEDRELELAERNRDARGIWSGGETMWVLDGGKNALFAYDLASAALLGEYGLDTANGDPRGIWSDGVTVWVSDHVAKRLLAYRLPAAPDAPAAEDAEPVALERVRDEEFDKLSRASNNSPRGIWSDGEVMYVADASDGKVYSYNMPDAIDARLASLTLSGVEIGEFGPGTVDYEGAAGEGVTQTTVEAEAAQSGATVVIDPPDADPDTEGHQVALEDLDETTVTVTSADGSRTKVYLVRFGGAVEAEQSVVPCLRGDIAVGFSLVVYDGGSVGDLVGCAESRGVTALYTLSGGEYVSYIIGAPEFVNARFGGLFADGVPALTPLTVRSESPVEAVPAAPAVTEPFAVCLRGEISEGFSLVVYEGGSVGDLEACAERLGVGAIYVLADGEYVPYILGAPEFVNTAFRELFPDGVPAATPLTVGRAGT